MKKPSPGEKGDRSASIGITILIINLAVAVDEEIHVTRCKILFGVNIRAPPLLGTVGNEVRHRKRSEGFPTVSILKHSQANARSRNPSFARIE